MERILIPGDLYKDKEERVYQIVCTAYSAETNEPMAVYQAMFDKFKVYTGSVENFMGSMEKVSVNCSANNSSLYNEEGILRGDDFAGRKAEYENAAERMEKFFDAESYREKLRILESMHSILNETMIDNIAMSLDLNIRPGDIEDEYGQIVYGLKTLIRFEDTRLR